MTEKTLLNQGDKDKEEERKSLRAEPGEVKPALRDISPIIEPKRPIKVPLKKTQENKEETVVSPMSAQAKIGASPKRETKSSPFFSFLFVLSLVFMAVALSLLLLPLRHVSIPPFLNSVINLVSP